MPSGSEETSANDLDAYWLGFDDKANMDVLSKALRFLLNLPHVTDERTVCNPSRH